MREGPDEARTETCRGDRRRSGAQDRQNLWVVDRERVPTGCREGTRWTHRAVVWTSDERRQW